jgi:enoyl-CoA hydratase/carnithine racemase
MSGPAPERDGTIAWIAVDDDAGDQAVTGLASSLRAAERNHDVRCVVVRGAAFRVDATSALVRLRETPLTTIAAWTGAVHGTGAALVLACDLRIATDAATIRFGATETPPSLAPGLSWQLERAVGRTRAFELLARNRTVASAELLELGLISTRTAHDALDSTVEALAAEIATHSRTLVAGLKRSLYFAEQVDFDESVEFDRLIDVS